MKAQLVQDHSHDRKVLADIVPLPAPLSLTVLASSICNLQCKYCVHGSGAPWLERVQRGGRFFELETAKKMVDGLRGPVRKASLSCTESRMPDMASPCSTRKSPTSLPTQSGATSARKP